MPSESNFLSQFLPFLRTSIQLFTACKKERMLLAKQQINSSKHTPQHLCQDPDLCSRLEKAFLALYHKSPVRHSFIYWRSSLWWWWSLKCNSRCSPTRDGQEHSGFMNPWGQHFILLLTHGAGISIWISCSVVPRSLYKNPPPPEHLLLQSLKFQTGHQHPCPKGSRNLK